MNRHKRNVFLFFIILYSTLIALSIVAFILLLDPIENQEGFFITPGNVQVESIFSVVTPGIVGALSGYISIFITTPIFVRYYAKFLGKKNKIGLVELKESEGKSLFKKIWGRSIILGFFVGNLCYTLASQEPIVEFMRNVNPIADYSIPDVETLWQLAWMLTIPSTLIVVPIFAMTDSGLVVIRKVKEAKFETVNLASSPLYKIIKGYAGIGFLYNLIVMIIFWVTPVIQRGRFEFVIIIQIISPLIAAGSEFPGVLILEYYKPYVRSSVEKVLAKLDMNNDLILNIELKQRI